MNIPHVASLLGIDPVTEPQYLWIANMAASAEVDPNEWKEFTNENGETMYYNLKLKVFQRQKGYPLSLVSTDNGILSEREEAITSVVQTVMERVDRKVPIATPEIIEAICRLLDIDCHTEFGLVRCIKATLEAFVQKKFDVLNMIHDLEEPVQALREAFKSQIREDIARKPIAIIMCQECEKRSSVLKCEQCLDHFCQECFDTLHATGNRRSHLIREVEQLVCVACDCSVADCQCIQCGSFFCNSCFVSIHSSRTDLHRHRKRTLSGLVCQECEHAHAAILCEDCVDLFCSPCYLRLHKNGQRKQHGHLTIDLNGQVFRAGLVVSPSEAQVLIDRARSTTASGPWIHYKDDNGSSFWQNCSTRDRSNVSM